MKNSCFVLLAACLLTGCSPEPPPAVVTAPRPAASVPSVPVLPPPIVLSAGRPNINVKPYSAKDYPPIHAEYRSVLPSPSPALSPTAQQEQHWQELRANAAAESAVRADQR